MSAESQPDPSAALRLEIPSAVAEWVCKLVAPPCAGFDTTYEPVLAHELGVGGCGNLSGPQTAPSSSPWTHSTFAPATPALRGVGLRA